MHRILAEAHLEAVEVLWVVAAGHLDAAVQVPVEEREVEEWRRTHTDIEHVEPGRTDALGHGGSVAIGGEPAVTPHAQDSLPRLRGERAKGAAEAEREIGVEVPLGDATDVVFAENDRVQSSTSMRWRSRRSWEIQFWKRSSRASL